MAMSMREKILQTVAKIIETEGLDAVSIRTVCDKVGVKAPTIYYYFTDKDDLIEAVIGLAYEKHRKTYAEFVKNRSAVKGLIKTWDSFFAFVENDPELFHAIVVAHLKRRIPQAGVELFDSIAEIFKKLEQEKRLKLPYDKATEVFYATAYGQALVYVSQDKNANLKESIRFTRDMCLRGLLKEK